MKQSGGPDATTQARLRISPDSFEPEGREFESLRARHSFHVQPARLSESRKPDDLLDFDDVIVDPFKYLSESEFSAGDRTHHEFESRDRIDGQVESIDKKKRVCGRKGYALVSVEKRMVVRQRFHESRRFLSHAVVIASLRAEYRGFQQTTLSNTIDPTVLIDLLFVDCENFGDGEVYTLWHLTHFASFS
jgi:hypothetical protein